MKNIKKSVAILNSKLLLVLTLTLCLVSQQLQAQFVGAALPNKFFPLPVTDYALPGTAGGGFWPTFYNQRNNGSCYNQSLDVIGGIYTGDEQIYVWAINAWDVGGYDNAIAYEILDNSGTTILRRGTAYVGADIANLNVGMYKTNAGALHVIVAYWHAGGSEIRLDDFLLDMSATSSGGLGLVSSNTVYTLSNTTYEAQHIGLDCHDLEYFTLTWEDNGYGIMVQGYDYSPGGPGAGPIVYIGSATSRIPDVAMSHNPSIGGPGGTKDVHLIFTDMSGMTPMIRKYTLDFNQLVAGTASAILEDSEPFTAFGPYWDDFNMRIDAPDHYTASLPDWSYVYFDDDNNKIKVRVCDQTGSPAYNTYVVNDGTVTVGPTGPTLPDLTAAGNAFPTITYHQNGGMMYVGWYTNYDPTLSPIANNPLYTYSTQTQGYISVVLDKTGFFRSSDYNRIDDDYLTNRIGTGINPATPYTDMYYPKVCFSKHNDGPQIFTNFSSHDTKTNLVWRWANWAGGAAFLGKYVESVLMAFPDDALGGTNMLIGYSGAASGSTFTTDPSVFLCQKQADWYPSSPLFRTTPLEAVTETKADDLSIVSNPFSSEAMFQLKGDNAKAVYTAFMMSADGKRIAEYGGTIAEINNQFKQTANQSLPTGVYHLQVNKGNSGHTFKLIKR